MKDYVIAYNEAQTKKWRQLVSYMNDYIKNGFPHSSNEAVLEDYDNFSKNFFTTAYINWFLEDFNEWLYYEDCPPERLSYLLDSYTKVIYALNKRNIQPDDSILNGLYEAYDIFPAFPTL